MTKNNYDLIENNRTHYFSFISQTFLKYSINENFSQSPSSKSKRRNENKYISTINNNLASSDLLSIPL